MAQRLIWNFAFATKNPFFIESLSADEKDHIKWEARVFWPEQQEVILNLIEPTLLDISIYNYKVREDIYYLLPNDSYNIKFRRNNLLYKPMVQHASIAIGFDTKINLDEPENYPKFYDAIFLQTMKEEAYSKALTIPVKKEAYIYKFLTTPKIKLELARLEVGGAIYMSACVEGRNLRLVETICEHLLGKQLFCDYQSFLKKIAS